MAAPESAPTGEVEPTSGSPVRRAPFSVNPQLGARGQRTRQRILDAALVVFGDEGYYQASIDRISTAAGCSRVSFYQYFAGKEDIFRELTGQVARQLRAAVEALDPLTADAAGWSTLHLFVTRCAEIHERYDPVYNVFDVASISDTAVATGAARWNERQIARFRASVGDSQIPVRQLDSVIALLLGCLANTLGIARRLRTAAPSDYPKERVDRSLTDLMHRTLFGVVHEVNVHAAGEHPKPLAFGAEMQQVFEQQIEVFEAGSPNRPALGALLDAGPGVFAGRGYHGTRVDDLVAAAGVSHGAFYRYFESKEQFARLLTARALQTVSSVFANIPTFSPDDSPAGRAALRRWLRRYNDVHASEAAMIRVYADAALHDATLRSESAPSYDWGRRRMAHYLAPRGFGDVDIDAVAMVALLGTFGGVPRSGPMIEAACNVIEHGLLGR